MMLQKKSNAWARLKYTYVLPLAVIGVIAFARPEISQPLDEISDAKVSNLISKIEPPGAENISPNEMARNINSSANIQVPDSTVFEVVEDDAQFPGGASALNAFLSQNINYPVAAMENGIQGRVTIAFIVEKDGSLTNVEILRGVDPALDAEAVRVVSLMPKWIPGKQSGEAVRMRYRLPVTFRLQPVSPASSPPSDRQASDSLIHPQFPGGTSELMDFLAQNIRYPKVAMENGIQGRVTIAFIVEKDGSLTNVEILRGVDPALDAEAARVISSMPKWIPGKKNGEAVSVRHQLPVIFRLYTNQPSTPPAPARSSYPPGTAYPNPVDNILFVNLDAFTAANSALPSGARITYDVRLYNGQGVQLLQQKAGNGTVELNVSNLPNGIYYLHIYNGVSSTPETRSIIVRH